MKIFYFFIKKIIPKKIVVWLRGSHNSVLQRFLSSPKEKINYFYSKLKGKTWIEFYSGRLNKFVIQNQLLKKEINNSYIIDGKNDLKYLIKNGLKPNHNFLDYGCGFLKTGLYVIPYLKYGNYTGVDISIERIKEGEKLLEKNGIKKNEFKTIFVKDCKLKELSNMKFDFIYAGSVLTHMPPQDIIQLFYSLKNKFTKNGVMYFSFHQSQSEKFEQINIKDFLYPLSKIKKFAEEAGYKFCLDADAKKNPAYNNKSHVVFAKINL